MKNSDRSYSKIEQNKKHGRLTLIHSSYRIRESRKGNKYKEKIWFCKCECGGEKLISQNALSASATNSCGCLRKEFLKNRKTENMAKRIKNYAKTIFKEHKTTARNNRKTTSLEIDEFEALITNRCFYCDIAGSKPVYQLIDGRDVIRKVVNGIDRKNNSQGYTTENSVSCCSRCNYAKHIMDLDEFVSWIGSVFYSLKQKGFLDKQELKKNWGFSIEEIEQLYNKTKQEADFILKDKKLAHTKSRMPTK